MGTRNCSSMSQGRVSNSKVNSSKPRTACFEDEFTSSEQKRHSATVRRTHHASITNTDLQNRWEEDQHSLAVRINSWLNKLKEETREQVRALIGELIHKGHTVSHVASVLTSSFGFSY